MTSNNKDVTKDAEAFQYAFPAFMRPFENFLVKFFKLKERNVTVGSECYGGLIHFVSCLYVLPVIPAQLIKAGYPALDVCIITALCCGLGSIALGVFANLPFIVAPPTAISIFLASFLRLFNLHYTDGNVAVIISGFVMILFGFRPFARLCGQLLPQSIQYATAIGIGLLTALAGCVEVNLIIKGRYTVLELGPLTPEIAVAMAGFVFIAIGLFYHVKASFCVVIVLCSIIYWGLTRSFPTNIVTFDRIPSFSGLASVPVTNTVGKLAVDIIILSFVTVNGLGRAFSDLAGTTKMKEGLSIVPSGRWMYIICGTMSVLSGFYNGPPFLISPESGSAIKSGARTGLSSIIGGICFLIAVFFAPLFEAVPAAGTAPLLFAIGVILFVNVKKIDWTDYTQAFPAFTVLFFIPFAYSILVGVMWGWAMFLIVTFFTGDMYWNLGDLVLYYAPRVHNILFMTRDDTAEGHGGASVWVRLSQLDWRPHNVCQKLWQELINFDDKNDENVDLIEPISQGDTPTNEFYNPFTDGPRVLEARSPFRESILAADWANDTALEASDTVGHHLSTGRQQTRVSRRTSSRVASISRRTSANPPISPPTTAALSVTGTAPAHASTISSHSGDDESVVVSPLSSHA